MRAFKTEVEALRSLQPVEVTEYLRATGWTLVDAWAKGSTWSHRLDGRERVVDVPNDRRFTDYPILISDTVAAIAQVEGRAELDIFTDLSEVSCDVIRVKVQGSQIAAGKIPLQHAERVVHGARDMMTAAACAAIEPQPVYDFRRERSARQYVADRVFLGQSQAGSYILAVLSEIPLALPLPGNQPFERRVTAQLLIALDAVKEATQQALRSRDVTVFQAHVPAGVSANLCQAIAGMSPTQSDGVVQLGFSWSPVHRQRDLHRRSVAFSRAESDVIQRAAQVLLEIAPMRDYEVVGRIVKCERARPDQPGTVTISTIVDDQLSAITTRLQGRAYQFAVNAHGSGRNVRLVGTLWRRGRAAEYELRDATIEFAD